MIISLAAIRFDVEIESLVKLAQFVRNWLEWSISVFVRSVSCQVFLGTNPYIVFSLS